MSCGRDDGVFWWILGLVDSNIFRKEVGRAHKTCWSMLRMAGVLKEQLRMSSGDRQTHATRIEIYKQYSNDWGAILKVPAIYHYNMSIRILS
jgi:hypothetical protein